RLQYESSEKNEKLLFERRSILLVNRSWRGETQANWTVETGLDACGQTRQEGNFVLNEMKDLSGAIIERSKNIVRSGKIDFFRGLNIVS
ncbi:MAG: hypothetical protein QXH17_09090, partial [Candidatus Bathyarchaeia archaeon]